LTHEARPAGAAVHYPYDQLGRLVGTDNATSHLDRIYDGADRLRSETTCANTGSPTAPCAPATGSAGQPTVTMSYDYFADGRLRSATSSDAGAVQYGYDSLGRLASIQSGS